MVPIENDPNPAATPLPYPKTRPEASARPPLVELEIPVTIYCDRIVEGSEKREPFSEKTRTVLVFSQGALVRIATTLIPGQRVFLFNEKAQKEVLCQVVKSAPGGSASGLVELQFSESAAGFWDLPIPAAPQASVTASSIAPAILETSPLVPPSAANVAEPNPLAPVWTFTAPANSTVALPPLPVVDPEPATRQFLASANFASPSSVASPAAASPAPKISPAQAGTAPAYAAIPRAPFAPKPEISVFSFLDFSEEITALFDGNNASGSVPVPPATSAPHPSGASSLPSVEQLMLQATRLQASLNSLHFSATLPAPPAPSAPPVTQNTEPLDAQAAKTVLEFTQGEAEPVVKSESESFLPDHQKIPPSISVEPLSDVSVSSKESFDVLVVEEPRRLRTYKPDAQVLGKSPVQPDLVTPTRQKKALILGLAASVLLVLGAGTLYLLQNHSTTTPAIAGALRTPSSPTSLPPAKNSTQVPSHAASATLATGQPPSASIPETTSALAVVELSRPPAPVEPTPTPAASIDAEPAANPPAESQPTVSTGGFAIPGADAAPEPAPPDVPPTAMGVADETPQPRPGVQLGGFEKPSVELAAVDPDRHRVSFEKDEGQVFEQGQHSGCTKNVTLGSVGKERLYLGIPEWASRWIEKNSKKLPGICFSDSPMSSARNFLIVFYTSVTSEQTELLRASASSSAASWPEGQGAFTTSYGSTWHYNRDGTVGTTVTSLLPGDSPHSRPAHVSYALAYTEDGMPISKRWPRAETKKSKEFPVKPASGKPGKKHDESAGAYRELEEVLSVVVIDIEKQ
jgi:hypothetical protein